MGTPRKIPKLMSVPKPENFVHPKQLLLSGNFEQQLNSLLSAIRLSREDVNNLHLLFVDLEYVMKSVWPESTIMPFGSIVTGLGIKGSDADCFVRINHVDRQTIHLADRVIRMNRMIFRDVTCIATAKVPIVKFLHVKTNMKCDLSFRSRNGVQNSKLLAFLHNIDRRIIRVAVAIKYWAEVYSLIGTNLLSKYALNLMIIFYFQQQKIIPPIAYLQRESKPFIIDGWDASYSAKVPPIENTSTEFHLLGGFFKYYLEFDFKKYIISPFAGYPIPREHFQHIDNVPDIFKLYKKNCIDIPLKVDSTFCIQDMFNHSRNCAVAVHTELAKVIQLQLQYAKTMYSKSESNEPQFLKTLFTNPSSNVQMLSGKNHNKNKKKNKERRKLKLKRLHHKSGASASNQKAQAL